MLMLMGVLVLAIVRLQSPDVVRMIGEAARAERSASAAECRQDGFAGRSIEPWQDGFSIRPSAERRAASALPTRAEPLAEVPLGPTDEDDLEAAEARDEFQAVTDGTTSMAREDMYAFRRVTQWVVNQPAPLMERRAKTGVTFNDLMGRPQEYRGKLLALDLPRPAHPQGRRPEIVRHSAV